MGRVTVALGFVSFAFLCGLTLHAQSPTPAPAQPTKDPAALSILSQMVAATGWTPSLLPEDAIAVGTVSSSQATDSTPANITLKVKSCGEYRIDTQDSSGPDSLIINGNGGARQSPSETDFIPSLSANSMQPLVLPFFCDLAYFTDSSVSVALVGTETVAGQAANKIQITRISVSSTSGAGVGPLPGGLTVWISTSTSLPIQLAWSWISDYNPAARLSVSTVLSDYRTIGGISVPFHQEQQANGKVTNELQLDSVSFNNGLADSIFALPAPTQQ